MLGNGATDSVAISPDSGSGAQPATLPSAIAMTAISRKLRPLRVWRFHRKLPVLEAIFHLLPSDTEPSPSFAVIL